jgi:D-3-phosphoglycerate dehydrogenase
MKRGAILVNTARGPGFGYASTAGGADEGHIARAGLDVFEVEPPPLDLPLRTTSRVTLTDHVAWYSEESQIELKITAAEEAVRVCTGGLPRSLANPEVLERLGRSTEWTPNDTVRWQLKRFEKLKRGGSRNTSSTADVR